MGRRQSRRPALTLGQGLFLALARGRTPSELRGVHSVAPTSSSVLNGAAVQRVCQPSWVFDRRVEAPGGYRRSVCRASLSLCVLSWPCQVLRSRTGLRGGEATASQDAGLWVHPPVDTQQLGKSTQYSVA